MDPEDNIQLPIIAVNMITTWILMSVESQSSFSNKLDQLRKSTVQDDQSTLPRIDTLPRAPFDSKSEDREEIAEPLCTDGPASLEMPGEQERGTHTPGS